MKILYTTFTFLLGCVLCLQNTSAQVSFTEGPDGINLSVDFDNINFDDPQAVLRPFLDMAWSQESLSLSDILSASDRFGNTLLHLALIERANPEAIEDFLNAGVPIHQTSNEGVSPIDQAEQMVRGRLEDLEKKHKYTPLLQRNITQIMQNWHIQRQWRDWFGRRYNTRRYIFSHPSNFSCPPGTRHSMGHVINTHHCIPQEFRFYEEEVYALIIIAEKNREQFDITPTFRP